MDEQLRKKLVVVLSIILIIFIGYINLRTHNLQKEQENTIFATNRSPLLDFRFLDFREKNGIYIDVIEISSGKKYENIFLSLTCPQIKNKPLGLVMKLSVLEQFRPATNETIHTLDRAYDYLCTNKNMAEEDKKLLDEIKAARERNMKNQEDLLLKVIPKTN